jgi:hypothetical protein
MSLQSKSLHNLDASLAGPLPLLPKLDDKHGVDHPSASVGDDSLFSQEF